MTQVATREDNLPAAVSTPALEIGAEDIALPRVYIGQFSSDAVQAGLVNAGDIFTATSKDDPDPVVLAKAKKDVGVEKDGPVFYVLGLRRGKSVSEAGELKLYDYDDPDAPKEAWTTYNYAIAIPSADEEVPFKMLLTRSSTPAAKNLNTILKKNESRGPAWDLAFELRSQFSQNNKGKFYVAKISHVQATDEGREVAAKLAEVVAGSNAMSMDNNATGEEPSI